MKTAFLLLTTVTWLVMLTTTSCFNTTKNKDEASVVQIKSDSTYNRQKAYLDSASKYMQFREEEMEKLNNYDRRIKELKEKMILQPIGIRAKYNSQLNGFDLSIATLEIKIDEFAGGNNADWELYKKGFSEQVSEIGKSIDDMAMAIEQKK